MNVGTNPQMNSGRCFVNLKPPPDIVRYRFPWWAYRTYGPLGNRLALSGNPWVAHGFTFSTLLRSLPLTSDHFGKLRSKADGFAPSQELSNIGKPARATVEKTPNGSSIA